MSPLITTHQHLGQRDEQQDRFCVLTQDKTTFAILADGMGGHSGGALAAQLLIDTAQDVFKQKLKIPVTELFTQITELAHERINEQAKKQNLQPHTTAVFCLIQHKQVHWGHVGDSRLYHFRHQQLIQHSKDHSVVQMLVDMGKISEKEAQIHPDRSRLLSCVGGDKDPDLDQQQFKIQAGDSLILCSDGLWENLNEQELGQITQSDKPQTTCKEVVELAVKRGGEKADNTSLILFDWIGKRPWYQFW
jgi:PPM family protein phosphatase